MAVLRCGKRELNLNRPQVMGILNITPDSFSDGGCYASVQQVMERASAMVAAGATVLDIGGESTRPGAAVVGEQEELDRVIPVVEAVAAALDVLISVDTSKAKVMEAAIAAGAGLINDVRALQLPGALDVVAASDVAVCLMHMQGKPRDMQESPSYRDLVSEINLFLAQRWACCQALGMERDRVLLDPGFGFGKTQAHNLTLVARLQEIGVDGLPLLFGASRKRTIGDLLDAPVDRRVIGSVAMALLAAERGAAVLRVHDVEETVQALTILDAVRGAV